MIGDWYVVRMGSGGGAVLDFSCDFHEACIKVDRLARIYPDDYFQVVHESKISEYLDTRDGLPTVDEMGE